MVAAPDVDIGSTLFSAMFPYALFTAGGGFMGWVIGILRHAIKIIMIVIGGLFTYLASCPIRGTLRLTSH